MCCGDVYSLSCGHTLVHYRSSCRKTRCMEPGGAGSHHFLADTCAKCDPAFRASQIGRKYRKAQAKLTEQLTAAIKARRAGEVARIHDELEALRERTNAAIGEETHRRTGSLGVNGVEFPTAHVPSVIGVIAKGGPEAAGYTSRWMDGKCVWMSVAEAERQIEEEQQQRVREGKPRVPLCVRPHAEPAAKVDPLEFLNRKLDEQRLRSMRAEVEDFEKRLEADERRKAKGKEREAAVTAAVDAAAVEATKARKAPQPPQPECEEPEDPVGEHLPLHPLRHKKKIAAWLPTDDELDELAVCMSDIDFLSERPPSFAGECSSSPAAGATAQQSRRTPSPSPPSGGEKYVIQGPKATPAAGKLTAAQQKPEDEDGDIWLAMIDREDRKRKLKGKYVLSPRARTNKHYEA